MFAHAVKGNLPPSVTNGKLRRASKSAAAVARAFGYRVKEVIVR